MSKYFVFIIFYCICIQANAQQSLSGKYYVIEANKVNVLEFKQDTVIESRIKEGILKEKSKSKLDLYEKWGDFQVCGIKGKENYFLVPMYIEKNWIRLSSKLNIHLDSLPIYQKKPNLFCKEFGTIALNEKYYLEVRKLKKVKDLDSTDIAEFMDIYLEKMMKLSSDLEIFRSKSGTDISSQKYLVSKYCLVESWIQAGYDPVDVMVENAFSANNQIDIFSKSNPEHANKIQKFAAFLIGDTEKMENPLQPRAPEND